MKYPVMGPSTTAVHGPVAVNTPINGPRYDHEKENIRRSRLQFCLFEKEGSKIEKEEDIEEGPVVYPRGVLYCRKFSSAKYFVKSDRQAVHQELIFVKRRSSLICSQDALLLASNQAQPFLVTTGFVKFRRHHINKGWAWFEASSIAYRLFLRIHECF